ncbi:MAG: aminopeptidase [Erysipelotrichaceae bacterium]
MQREQIVKYARLLVEKGINIQPGQTLLLQACLEAKDIALEVSKQAFERGAKDVVIQWDEPELTRLRAEYCDAETLRSVKSYELEEIDDILTNNGVQMGLNGTYPNLFDGIENEKAFAIGQHKNDLRNVVRKHIHQGMQWTGCAFPNKAWATKVYPDLSPEDAHAKLEDAVCKMVRVNDDLDPIVEWDKHCERLGTFSQWLNSLGLKSLHITSELGTDITMEVVENHIWVSAGEMGDQERTPYIANIPTEEIFCDPHKLTVNGIAYASRPLIMNGKLVTDFSITFKDGKAVDCTAATNIDALKETINKDATSCYLGEVALVSKQSPITQTNTVFFNGLVDENAASHLALGNSFPDCIKGGSKMSKEELDACGVNSSAVHCDFMIGTPDFKVVGTTKAGETVTLMEHGDFVETK